MSAGVCGVRGVLGDVVDACRDIRGAIHAGADDVVKDKASVVSQN